MFSQHRHFLPFSSSLLRSLSLIYLRLRLSPLTITFLTLSSYHLGHFDDIASPPFWLLLLLTNQPQPSHFNALCCTFRRTSLLNDFLCNLLTAHDLSPPLLPPNPLHKRILTPTLFFTLVTSAHSFLFTTSYSRFFFFLLPVFLPRSSRVASNPFPRAL